MAHLHLSSQQEHVALGFGLAAPLLAIGGAYLLLRDNDVGAPHAAGLVLVLLSLPLAAITAALGFRPLISGNIPWPLRPLVVANLLVLAAVATFVAYQVAMALYVIIQIFQSRCFPFCSG